MDEILRRLVEAAYEQGWTDACHDWRLQADGFERHAIGTSKRDLEGVLMETDPSNLLGLR